MLLFLLVLFAPAGLAELAISGFHFHSYEDSPPLAVHPLFQAGENVNLSFRIIGFQAVGDEPKMHVRYQIEVRDPAGRPVAPPKSGEVKAQIAPEDKEWMPKIRHGFQVPGAPQAGEYKVLVRVSDKLGKKDAEQEFAFEVESPYHSAPEGLKLTNFHFLRGENGPEAVGGSFQPGDMVWGRFEMTGYKFAAKNRYKISYGVELRDLEGKVLFREPKAAAESEASFYPKLYVSGLLSLSLDKTIKPSRYTLVVFLRDEIGDQQIDSEHPFRVE
ncbi:MAG: hypothetical protein HYZ57_06030 [Acidobacteria bacterium]|nr:hypothetical protein [Acidobacteriota bacterium]